MIDLVIDRWNELFAESWCVGLFETAAARRAHRASLSSKVVHAALSVGGTTSILTPKRNDPSADPSACTTLAIRLILPTALRSTKNMRSSDATAWLVTN